jgi:hypothetical protein
MNGFSARFFNCSLEALAAARSESPHLVISDVVAVRLIEPETQCGQQRHDNDDAEQQSGDI